MKLPNAWRRGRSIQKKKLKGFLFLEKIDHTNLWPLRKVLLFSGDFKAFRKLTRLPKAPLWVVFIS